MIDATPKDPREFTIERHAPLSVFVGDGDHTGRYLKDYRCSTYADSLMRDYLWVKSIVEPLLTEVIWAEEGLTAGAYFLRLVLPFNGKLVS